MKKGSLIISLDFELIWGIFDHVEITYKVDYFNNTLDAIPKMLELFSTNKINVSWATVGMLYNENWEEWHANIPSEIPTYQRSELDAYNYGKKNQNSGFDKFFFAPNLIRLIQSTPYQEIGTHTYSHFYCLEKGQTIIQFDADIFQAKKVASQFNISLNSLVFPRNQFNKEYLEVCEKHGIETVRTNPDTWYWDTTKPDTLVRKVFRSGDAYFPFGKKSFRDDSLKKETVFCQPASRFLRPQSKYDLLNSLRLTRIKYEIIQAAKNGEAYHLWWHPHNFGLDKDGALKALAEIIEVFNMCREEFGMESLSMKQYRDRFFV